MLHTTAFLSFLATFQAERSCCSCPKMPVKFLISWPWHFLLSWSEMPFPNPYDSFSTFLSPFQALYLIGRIIKSTLWCLQVKVILHLSPVLLPTASLFLSSLSVSFSFLIIYLSLYLSHFFSVFIWFLSHHKNYH